MSDKLSQEQIDALLSQMSEGKVVDESTEIGDFGAFIPMIFINQRNLVQNTSKA